MDTWDITERKYEEYKKRITLSYDSKTGNYVASASGFRRVMNPAKAAQLYPAKFFELQAKRGFRG